MKKSKLKENRRKQAESARLRAQARQPRNFARAGVGRVCEVIGCQQGAQEHAGANRKGGRAKNGQHLCQFGVIIAQEHFFLQIYFFLIIFQNT